MPVLVIYTFEKDVIKNNREKVETSFSPLQVNGHFLLPWKPDLIQSVPQDFMPVLITYKFEKDVIKNNKEKVETLFSPL